MAIYSPLRSRRLAAQHIEATRRLITFNLGEEIFALPLDQVHKVTTINRLYGDPNHTGISLTTYQGRELVVIDVGYQVFGKLPQVVLPSQKKSSVTVETQHNLDLVRYLLILQPEPGQLVGLPIDSPPSIQSIQLSAFQPLPDIYRQHSNIHCVSTMSVDLPDRPSIFLLDVDLLAEPR
jgi:chemotaxis signal transduction protein